MFAGNRLGKLKRFELFFPPTQIDQHWQKTYHFTPTWIQTKQEGCRNVNTLLSDYTYCKDNQRHYQGQKGSKQHGVRFGKDGLKMDKMTIEMSGTHINNYF